VASWVKLHEGEPRHCSKVVPRRGGFASLSPEDRYRFPVFLVDRLRHSEKLYYHDARGLLEDSVWPAYGHVLKDILATPGAVAWWREDSRRAFPDAFVAEVGSLLQSPKTR
jgi:hypothetical protein